VGSLLRPSSLLQARVDFSAGRLDRAGLCGEEDRAILDALSRQRMCGVDVFSDGELRRASFITVFIDAMEGFVKTEPEAQRWRGGTGKEPPPPSASFAVASRLRARGRIAGVESAFLRRHSPNPYKVTLPSPALFRSAHRAGISEGVYATPDDLVADAASILADEAAQLAAEGVPYIQVDSPSYSGWIEPGSRPVDQTPAGLDAAIAADNLVLDAARKGGAVTAVHICRGNSMGRWLVDGGYDPIAERLFTRLRCDRLLLEYDSPRAGDFRPLRFVPPTTLAVLGLITTKTGTLESRDELLRRIDQASRILPLEQLAISPQCGFASSLRGNPVTEDEQWRKLELVASLAREVWP
jgi:5-methyltetrahydropteroyltriglutamate--homocysteine methyltransferase